MLNSLRQQFGSCKIFGLLAIGLPLNCWAQNSQAVSERSVLLVGALLLVIAIFIGKVTWSKQRLQHMRATQIPARADGSVYVDVSLVLACAQDIYAPLFDSRKQQLTFTPDFNPLIVFACEDAVELLINHVLEQAFLFHLQPNTWQLSARKHGENLLIVVDTSEPSIAEAFCLELNHQNEFNTLLAELKGRCFEFDNQVIIALWASTEQVQRRDCAVVNEVMLELAANALLETEQHASQDTVTSFQVDGTQTRLILLAADSAVTIEAVGHHLAEHYQLATAKTPAELATCALAQIPDVIVVCQHWLHAHGLWPIEQLHQEVLTSHIPILLLAQTGNDYGEHTVDCVLDRQCCAQLTAHLEGLMSQMKQACEQWQKWLCEPHFEWTDEPQVTTQQTPPSAKTLQHSHADFLQRIDKVLSAHISDSRFDVAQLASLMHSSKRQLNRKMKGLLGMTPGEAIRHYRLKKAALRLKEGEAPSVVTYDVGFTSHAYFSACFKARFGCSPSAYGSQPKSDQKA